MIKPQIALGVSIDSMLESIEYSLDRSTKVVGWWAHHEEVRGPYGRWLSVSKVESDNYPVSSQACDASYAANCMNYAPSLVEEIRRLRALLINDVEGKLP